MDQKHKGKMVHMSKGIRANGKICSGTNTYANKDYVHGHISTQGINSGNEELMGALDKIRDIFDCKGG